jgi:hypothetical protein
MEKFQYSHASEKLQAARRTLMLPHRLPDDEVFAEAFRLCADALEGGRLEAVKEETARRWVFTIVKTLDFTGLVDPNRLGLNHVKAGAMSHDELEEFSSAVDELATWTTEN